MIPKSIRWRLPLTHAGIALLAALALGAVLWTTLRAYYQRQESDYLETSAKAITPYAALLLEGGLSADALRAQLESLSFMSQTRVRILDSEARELGDSGDPRDVRELASVSFGLEVGGLSQQFSRSVEGGGQQQKFSSEIVIRGPGAGTDEGNVRVREEVVVSGADPGDLEQLAKIEEKLTGEPSLIPSGSDAPLGLGFIPEAPLGAHRSEQVLRLPLHDPLGELTGYVELSEGPAIGREVLNTVSWGWAVSAGVAVLLAASVGWFISSCLSSPLLALTRVTTNMTGGDLTTRANVAREDELGELAHSFNEMADRVEQTVHALRSFVADAAHQLLTPLTALRTNLDLMARDGESPGHRALVDRAQVQVQRLETLASELLYLSRLEAGVVEKDLAPVNLVALVQESSELYASQAEQAGMSFSLDLPDESITVMGNEAQLREALGNLFHNAIKFTPEGGAVSATLQQEAKWAILSIADAGIGIPDDDLPYVFDRFHRGRNAAAYEGSGLGLAIVKAIVEGHGGQVSAESTHQGACFSVQLACA